MATKTTPKSSTAKATKAPATKAAPAAPAPKKAPAKPVDAKPAKAVTKPAAKDQNISAQKTVAAPALQKSATKPTAKPAAKPAPAKTPTAATPKAAATKPAPQATTKPAPTKPPVAPVPAKPKQPAVPLQKWAEIRDLLLQMKTVTLQEIARSIKKGSEASVGEEPTGDIYDQASSERDRELGLILNDREREKLHSIDDALLRMDDGEYGICEECDEDIPLGRLKAMPFTRHCVKCKSDLEKLQAQTRRFEEDRSYREMPGGDEDEA